MEQLEGIVESITYKSDDGMFVVFRLKPLAENSALTVVGNLSAPFIGEQLILQGNWVEHVRFGRQFKAVSARRAALTTVQGIERFLGSGAVKGVGRAMAARLVKHFGKSALRVIEFEPERLTEVAGIGAKKADMIHFSYAALAEMREVMLFLESYGVTGAYATRIYARYGSQSVAMLQENPYRLAVEVDGIGFRIADQIALSMGFSLDDANRIEAGIFFALLQISQAGHTCVPEDTLVEETAKLLRAPRIEVGIIVAQLIKDNRLRIEDFHSMVLVYPEYLYQAERKTAQHLLRLKDKAAAIMCSQPDQAVTDWEKNCGIELAEAQRQAMISALTDGVLVLTGGPGTGKTTVVRGMIDVLESIGYRILLGAPTGRAAKRLSESAGRSAVTVHRLLESTGGQGSVPYFARNEEQPLEADVVILDEVSMMDIALMSYFLQAVPDGCRVVLVGDIDQLPAVGPGNVLRDIIRSQTVAVVRLTEIFRQAAQSMIVRNAHKINRGLMPDCYSSREFELREMDGAEEVAQAIVDVCCRELPILGYDSMRDVQVLSPMHRQACGVENMNLLLQARLNPSRPGEFEIAAANQVFRSGDKVMQIKNNYEKNVYNGDIGFIVDVEPSRVIVRYPEDDVAYDKGELDELRLAYAMSVHKSQGSEYRVVVLPLVAGHYIMLQRNLLYTAVTRAREKVILLGSKAALHTAVSNDRTRRRYSLLAERLRGDALC